MGKAFIPTELRACFPFSPNTATIKSLYPFITFGYSVNLSIQLTIPKAFTILFAFFISPNSIFNTAKRSMPASRAASYSCSIVRSFPSFPLYNCYLFFCGPLPDTNNRLPTLTMFTYVAIEGEVSGRVIPSFSRVCSGI